MSVDVDGGRHNHVTRDVKPPGVCPRCDELRSGARLLGTPRPVMADLLPTWIAAATSAHAAELEAACLVAVTQDCGVKVNLVPQFAASADADVPEGKIRFIYYEEQP